MQQQQKMQKLSTMRVQNVSREFTLKDFKIFWAKSFATNSNKSGVKLKKKFHIRRFKNFKETTSKDSKP